MTILLRTTVVRCSDRSTALVNSSYRYTKHHPSLHNSALNIVYLCDNPVPVAVRLPDESLHQAIHGAQLGPVLGRQQVVQRHNLHNSPLCTETITSGITTDQLGYLLLCDEPVPVAVQHPAAAGLAARYSTPVSPEYLLHLLLRAALVHHGDDQLELLHSLAHLSFSEFQMRQQTWSSVLTSYPIFPSPFRS